MSEICSNEKLIDHDIIGAMEYQLNRLSLKYPNSAFVL